MMVKALLLTAGFLLGGTGLAYAQASIAGIVKDATGAVLPGVTVEASSPALIERGKVASTDETGQYLIPDLRPGTYTVTFTLANFATVRREGIVLTGSFAATVNADLPIGTVEGAITVSGAVPTVDVKSTTKQWVIAHEIIDAVPSGRTDRTLGVPFPGITATACAPGGPTCQDLGGTLADQFSDLTIHGSTGADQRVTENGLSLGTLARGGQNTTTLPNLGAIQEVTIDSAGVSPEMATGGVRTNFIPRDGGNVFKGTMFAGGTARRLQGDNLSPDLRNRGLAAADAVDRNWDLNPGIGGPVMRDRLWFYASTRYNGVWNYAGGMFVNQNANNPNAWTYVPDLSRQASNRTTWKDVQSRLTWQATPKQKLSVTYDHQERCSCPYYANGTTAPEAGADFTFPVENYVLADWSVPMTTRLLFEGGLVHRVDSFGNRVLPGMNPAMIAVTEQSTLLNYRARATYSDTLSKSLYYRAAASYVTGTHALKIGFNGGSGFLDSSTFSLQPISYQFNLGVPNLITLYATPYRAVIDQDGDLGLYVQDRWTVRRLTLNLAGRYDYFADSIPAQTVGPATLVPSQNTTFPATRGVAWHDVTPRIGGAYDLFGDQKTAVKVSLNRYLAGQQLSGPFGLGLAPASRIVTSTIRTWSDSNRNFVPDCDVTNLRANGECGPASNFNFGQPVTGTAYDPATLTGWGKRGYNWEFSGGVERELWPRASLDVAYFRRWYGNIIVTDNRAVTPNDYQPYQIIAPLDPRLPDGGGYTISGLYDVKPALFGKPADNYITFSDRFGSQFQHWNGLDVIMSGHLSGGTLFRGGISSGRTTMDDCDVVTQINNPSPLYCHQDSGFLTQVKALGVYQVPRLQVQLSGAFQSLPGPSLSALYTATNAQVSPSLGRNLSGGINATATINLIAPGTMYGDRINQLDLRLGRIFLRARKRIVLNADLYRRHECEPGSGRGERLRDMAAAAIDSHGTARQARVTGRLLIA